MSQWSAEEILRTYIIFPVAVIATVPRFTSCRNLHGGWTDGGPNFGCFQQGDRTVCHYCAWVETSFFKIFLKVLFIYFQRERKGGRRSRRETSMCGASHVAPTGDLACNPSMCPDCELNRPPFGSQPALNLQTYTSQGWRHPLVDWKSLVDMPVDVV